MSLEFLTTLWPVLVVVAGTIIWAIRAEARSKSNELIATEARRLAQSNSDALGAFREKVAQEYVTITALGQLRVDIFEAINRLGDRFDRFFQHERGE